MTELGTEDHRSPCEWYLYKVYQALSFVRSAHVFNHRCPMECRLQNSAGPWKCQVFLRFEKDELGQRILDVREVKFGPLLTDKSKLEEMLRRAQLAILNPSVPHTSFVELDTTTIVPGEPMFGDKKSLQFSSNVVALDLYGPRFMFNNGMEVSPFLSP